MKTFTTLVTIFCFTLGSPLAWAKPLHKPLHQIETIDTNIEATVYTLKKTKYYTLVEIGFKNTADHYVTFSPKEIYLNDRNKYSVAPLPYTDVENLARQSASSKTVSVGSLIGAIILVITGVAVSNAHHDLATGLAIAALALGGTFVISTVLEAAAKDKRLITFENNNLKTIDKLPPEMTLGGFLYFPRTAKPASLTIIVKNKNGAYERKEISIKKIKKPRKTS